MAANKSILTNLSKIFYNEGMTGYKFGNFRRISDTAKGFSKDSIKTILQKYGYKAKVSGLRVIRYK